MPTQLLWEAFSHAAINAQRPLCSHIHQVCIVKVCADEKKNRSTFKGKFYYSNLFFKYVQIVMEHGTT